jgi:hypothetical protein
LVFPSIGENKMSQKYNLRQWCTKFNDGKFDALDIHTQCVAGWYDWFCNDKYLASKTQKLGKMVVKICRSEKINVFKQYVFFKNNCPMSGPLYDDFRICDMKTGDVIWTVTPKSGHTGKAELYGKENDFADPIVTGTMKDIYNYFGV